MLFRSKLVKLAEEFRPQMNADNTDLHALSEKVLGAVFEVSNTLGAGFLEKVYLH